jgi:hypothetical protein
MLLESLFFRRNTKEGQQLSLDGDSGESGHLFRREVAGLARDQAAAVNKASVQVFHVTCTVPLSVYPTITQKLLFPFCLRFLAGIATSFHFPKLSTIPRNMASPANWMP